MRELFSIVRDILLLKRGPQDMPYAPNLTMVLVFIGIAMQASLELVVNESIVRAGLIAIAMVGFSLGILYLLLNARQLTARFTQTVLTQALTSLVLSLLLLPLLAVVLGAGPPSAAAVLTPGQAIAALFVFGVVLWDFIVDAHIMRNALDVPFGAGVLIVILTRVATFVLVASLFGKPDGP